MMKGGSKGRSRRVVQDSSMAVERSKVDDKNDSNKDSRWSNLPLELLREVLIKVEKSELYWPMRKHVVACAGVCKSWREIMKEVVKIPEFSGRLTFPISVKQPGPRDSLLPGFIRRDSISQTYRLFCNCSKGKGKFILAAQKRVELTHTDYKISLLAARGSNTYIGKLRSNFLGTKFIVYDAFPPQSEAKVVKSLSSPMVGSTQITPRIPVGNHPVAHISYDLNGLGTRGPRRMQCIMDGIPASSIKPGGVAPTQTHFPIVSSEPSPMIPFFRSKSSHLDEVLSQPSGSQGDGALVLRNKAPRWHDQLQCWCLNFHGRVTIASVKNFQLVASPENGVGGPGHEKVILWFGKVGKDVFTMDYRYPLSAFQAFAICLSSFDTKSISD